MSVMVKGMEMPKDCLKCPFCLFADGYWKCLVDGSHADFGGTCRPSLCPLVPVPPHGRLIDADKIGLTDFEIILCQKGNPFKNALEMLLEKIENAPTVIPSDGKDTDVPTREEGE